jgi:hypothetical protein
MRLRSDSFGKRSRKARLANAGLAGDQHDAPFAAFGVLPAAHQYFDFLVAADESRCLRV